jgi:hypothetical protein
MSTRPRCDPRATCSGSERTSCAGVPISWPTSRARTRAHGATPRPASARASAKRARDRQDAVARHPVRDPRHRPLERVQDFCSYARLVQCAHESAGKRSGKSSEAAVLFLRANPEGMKYKKRLEQKHGKSQGALHPRTSDGARGLLHAETPQGLRHGDVPRQLRGGDGRARRLTETR